MPDSLGGGGGGGGGVSLAHETGIGLVPHLAAGYSNSAGHTAGLLAARIRNSKVG